MTNKPTVEERVEKLLVEAVQKNGGIVFSTVLKDSVESMVALIATERKEAVREWWTKNRLNIDEIKDGGWRGCIMHFDKLLRDTDES